MIMNAHDCSPVERLQQVHAGSSRLLAFDFLQCCRSCHSPPLPALLHELVLPALGTYIWLLNNKVQMW